ncbi:SusC/RagA family TonB-linked outer membrane protein [Saccharicrinis sp. GN24d3]|uniref:SusC/RagA family TonB-linked outer membrane protein n=1 Tax=Saccharicrinis sp. GN24d3 TaxID=3458416 RepID=UPI0040350978
MKKILLMFLWVISISVFAQTQKVTGNITDTAGEPLPGVTIVVKGTTLGTISDVKGNYILPNVPTDGVIQISFIGMATQDIEVAGKSIINAVLEFDLVGLDEVVAIGYGTVRKKDLTGSVATVNTKNAYSAPVANIENSIQGMTSGVQVTSGSGNPGSVPTIRIRGGNSISAGNSPLYVIDGFIGAGTSINPNDIESMQVLKDASSTAIYGARGANGVILITTKKGRNSAPVVNFKSSYGMQYLPEKVGVQSAREFANWKNIHDPQSDGEFDLDNLPASTDWQDVLIGPAPITDNQISVTGGTDKINYYMSAGYMSQDGIVESTDFKRYSLRSNIDVKLSKIFKTGINLSIVETSRDINNIDFKDLVREDPLKDVYDSEGYYNIVGYGKDVITSNLLADNELDQNDNVSDRALINTYIQASLFNNKLVYKSTFGTDVAFTKIDKYSPSTNPINLEENVLGYGSTEQKKAVDMLNENTLNYKESFGDHSIGVLGGITFQKAHTTTTKMSFAEMPTDGVGINSVQLAPVENTGITSNYSQSQLVSFLARANYSYKGKYLLTATFRRDGSSKVGGKYANFPSAAVAWNAADESFVQDLSVFDVLKLRASYGWTGSQSVGAYSTLSTYAKKGTAAIIGGTEVAGVTQGNLANPSLDWERTEQMDLGIEFAVLNRRLTGEVDFYYKTTHDLLLDASLMQQTGYDSQTTNVGSVKNNGVDITLHGVILNTSDWNWSTTLNISTFKNEVIDLGSKSFIEVQKLSAPANDWASQLMVGEPVGTFWGYVYDGIDLETGDAIFKDLSGPDGIPDGEIDADDKTVIGDATPDFYGGLQTNLSWKNIDFMASFPFSYGNDVYNMEAYLANEGTINSFASIRDKMWIPGDPNGTNKDAVFPTVGNSTMYKSNSFYIQDGSFLRLANLQVGYTLPENLIKGISNCRFYVTGTNLFLAKDKDYWGYDPDVSGYGDNSTKRGFDNMQYPLNRSYIVGLDITF